MSWNKTLPLDDTLLINAPGYLRANFEAIELGTDSALLITNAKCASDMALVDSKLAQITTADKVSGTALTLLPNIPAGAGVIPVANLPVGTTANKIVQLDANAKLPAVDASQVTDIPAHSTDKLTSGTLPTARGGTGTTAAANAASGVVVLNASSQLPAVSGALLTNLPVSDTNTSNVIFQWVGNDTYTSLLPNATGLQDGVGSCYSYHSVSGTTERNILVGKFKKIAGISTITIQGRLWRETNQGTTYLKVDIGGQNNTLSSTSNTPAWATAADIDVSGLTNGTVYDIVIYLYQGDAKIAYCSAVVLIAS